MSRTRVYVGIGSNIYPRINTAKAVRLLAESYGELQISKRFQTQALGFEGDDFINLVVSFYTAEDFSSLAKTLKNIEQSCGRDRASETCKGSRTMDLDILIYGNFEGEIEGCLLPRQDIFERQFVWQPLLEIFDQTSLLSEFEIGLQKQLAAIAAQAIPIDPLD